MGSSVPVLILDLDTTMRFLRSTATIRAIAEGTSMQWKTYDDSTALNVVYCLMPWKEKPGWVEVNSPSTERIRERSAALTSEFVLQWVKTLPQGPAAMQAYLNRRAALRASDLDNIAFVQREAQAINAQVDGTMRDTIKRLAQVKLAGTIAIAVLGGGASIALGAGAATITAGGASMAIGGGGMAVGGVATGYSIVTSIIKDWGGAGKAKVVGIAVGKEGGKAGLSEALGAGAESVIEKAAESQATYEAAHKSATRQVEIYSKRVSQEGRARVNRRAASKLAEREGRQRAAQKGMENAGKMASFGKYAKVGIPIVFAAWDIVEAYGDYNDTIAANR